MKKIFLLPIIASLFLLSCQQKTPISGEQSSDHSSNESSESMSTVTDENIPYESIRDTTFENLRFSRTCFARRNGSSPGLDLFRLSLSRMV